MANERKPRLCVMAKGETGYGFHLHGEKGKTGQFIRKVEPASPAEESGLRAGDRVVAVNGVNVEKETHHQASGSFYIYDSNSSYSPGIVQGCTNRSHRLARFRGYFVCTFNLNKLVSASDAISSIYWPLCRQNNNKCIHFDKDFGCLSGDKRPFPDISPRQAEPHPLSVQPTVHVWAKKYL